jgi:hypothetical protein
MPDLLEIRMNSSLTATWMYRILNAGGLMEMRMSTKTGSNAHIL